MNRMDFYISKMFWGNFIGALLVFVTIFVSIDAMSTLVTYKGVAMVSFLKFYGYSLPEVIYRMIPVASVLALVFTLSTINRSNEMVALFSIGMGLVRICTPILISIFVICGFVFILGDRVMPEFTKKKNFIFYHEIKKTPTLYSMVKTNKIWYRSKDTIFYLKTLNEKTQKAQGLTLYYFDSNWNLMQMITAKEVDLKGANWKLYDGSVTLFAEDSSFPLTSQFKAKTIVMGEDAKDLSSTAHTSDVLNMDELTQFIKKNKDAGLDTVRYEVDLHSKYGFSFAALVMSLLGIPFSVTRSRTGGAMASIGVGLGLVFLYWMFYSSCVALGKYGYLPPLLSAWIPNLLMAVLAAHFIRKAKV